MKSTGLKAKTGLSKNGAVFNHTTFKDTYIDFDTLPEPERSQSLDNFNRTFIERDAARKGFIVTIESQ